MTDDIDNDQYIRNRYENAIEYYWRASRNNKRWYKVTRSLTVILGAMVTLIASLSSSSIFGQNSLANEVLSVSTPMMAALLTIIAGFSQSFQWGSAWQNMVLTAQHLQAEFDEYLVTSPDKRDYRAEVLKLNEFILVESSGFFDRMLGGAKIGGKEDKSNSSRTSRV